MKTTAILIALAVFILMTWVGYITLPQWWPFALGFTLFAGSVAVLYFAFKDPITGFFR